MIRKSFSLLCAPCSLLLAPRSKRSSQQKSPRSVGSTLVPLQSAVVVSYSRASSATWLR